MAHNCDHDNGSWRNYSESEEEHIHSEADVDLYTQVGHVGLLGLVLSTYFMWISNSHTAFGEVLHGVADISTVYAMAGLAYLHKKGKITKAGTNRRAGIFNTVLLALAAVGVWIELQMGHRHDPDLRNMAITAGIALVSNLAQFWMLHKAHGHSHRHDKHVSMFSSTVQHVASDILFDLVALATVLTAVLSDLGASRLDEYAARLLIGVLVIMVGKNIWKLIHHEELELL